MRSDTLVDTSAPEQQTKGHTMTSTATILDTSKPFVKDLQAEQASEPEGPTDSLPVVRDAVASVYIYQDPLDHRPTSKKRPFEDLDLEASFDISLDFSSDDEPDKENLPPMLTILSYCAPRTKVQKVLQNLLVPALTRGIRIPTCHAAPSKYVSPPPKTINRFSSPKEDSPATSTTSSPYSSDDDEEECTLENGLNKSGTRSKRIAGQSFRSHLKPGQLSPHRRKKRMTGVLRVQMRPRASPTGLILSHRLRA